MIVAKANKMQGFLKTNYAGIVGSAALLRLYCSLVRQHFCFCSQLWVPQSIIGNLLLVENIQRRATRFMIRKFYLSCGDRLVKLKLLPLNYRLEYLDLIFYFERLHGYMELPREFQYYFIISLFLRIKSAVPAQDCILRQIFLVHLFFVKIYFNRVISIWNSLPREFKESVS